MEKATPVYRVNSKASMALSTSMDPFLNTNESCQNATTNSNTFYKSLDSYIWFQDYCRLLYMKNCKLLGRYAQVCSIQRFFLDTTEENLIKEEEEVTSCFHWMRHPPHTFPQVRVPYDGNQCSILRGNHSHMRHHSTKYTRMHRQTFFFI